MTRALDSHITIHYLLVIINGTIQSDVDLMLANAVKYNSDPGNPYRHAAEDMKKRHDKIVKRVWEQIQQRQQAQQQKAAAS